MERQSDKLNKRAFQLIRELREFNSIKERSNWIAELPNSITELSFWITELSNSITKLSHSITELSIYVQSESSPIQ